MKKYLSDKDLAERYGVNRSTIWRWSQAGIFPKPVSIAPGTTRWKHEDVERADLERAQESGAA